ncbi:MAG TPA: FMN-binding negative transcriptional regulator [Cyclobacteriaceae bacterium]|jgi:transcriptional regulator|nr:FMN-binding negative transcriptional regulator [Cyclobacteriaceae bacterium]
MYTPAHFKNENQEELKEFIRQNGFGILVSQVEKKIWATHIPLVLTSDNKLWGHISLGNKQSKSLPDGEEVMVIFTGPHTYISSSWYDHENVPTWNYIAVHVYGKIRTIEGDELVESLRQLTNKYEKNSTHPVSVDTMAKKYLDTQMRGILGIEITINQIEASYKLSQNRDEKNHTNIISELEKRKDENSADIANAMRKYGYRNKVK